MTYLWLSKVTCWSASITTLIALTMNAVCGGSWGKWSLTFLKRSKCKSEYLSIQKTNAYWPISSVNRKLTHASQYLHVQCNYPSYNKCSVAQTLLHWSKNHSFSTTNRKKEQKRNTKTSRRKSYLPGFIKQCVRKTSTTEMSSTSQQTNLSKYIPYIESQSTAIRRILQPYSMQHLLHQFQPSGITSTPERTLLLEEQTRVNYSISCIHCNNHYISETGGSLKTREVHKMKVAKVKWRRVLLKSMYGPFDTKSTGPQPDFHLNIVLRVGESSVLRNERGRSLSMCISTWQASQC